MRILYVFNKMHNLGGMERILTAKMNYLADNTPHEIFFLMYGQEDIPIPFPLSSRVHYLPVNSPIIERENLNFFQWVISYYKSRKKLKKEFGKKLKSLSPQIVVCTTYSFDELDILLDLSKKHAKVIVESHVAGRIIGMSHRLKYNPFLWYIAKLWDMYMLNSIKKCDCFVTLTNADAVYWRRYVSFVNVIPNMMTVRADKVVTCEERNVISVGRYTYQKGFDMLIEAWSLISSKYPNWRLYIYGSGDRSEFEKLVKKYHLEGNICLKPATADIVVEYLKSSIYVMSSRYEGFGLVLTEAMSCGLPCISFDCPYGPAEIIKNGINGYLVEPNNVKALSECLDLLMSDGELRKRLGAAAVMSVERYTVSSIMKKWIDLFHNLSFSISKV